MRYRNVLAIALALGLAPAAANAQQASSLQLGFSGGVAVPSGELADEFGTGYTLDARLGIAPATLPVGFRGDFSFAQFPEELHDEHSYRIVSGALNVVLPIGPAARFYVLAGGGLYRAEIVEDGEEEDHEDEHGASSTTDPGLNGGAGFQFGVGGITGFIEARMVNIFGEHVDVRYFPITIGFRVL